MDGFLGAYRTANRLYWAHSGREEDVTELDGLLRQCCDQKSNAESEVELRRSESKTRKEKTAGRAHTLRQIAVSRSGSRRFDPSVVHPTAHRLGEVAAFIAGASSQPSAQPAQSTFATAPATAPAASPTTQQQSRHLDMDVVRDRVYVSGTCQTLSDVVCSAPHM